MKLDLPNLTSDRVCCPTCRERAPFLANGLTDWHTTPAGGVCSDVFPAYVTARDPQTRRPTPADRRRLLHAAASGAASFVWDGTSASEGP